ncbi:type IV secretory system conjugative DNA transfer family protein [Burkholderia ubonensis]|uniref:type IV secretory system conjugative DNA transfer family protein n=1 Tax=Burkholderia ubonensis TaxID=101571 RepID=UPI00075BF73C|nr:type IV secretory system conjugative DNA transfer family protein [Burkholderia ubonensis]KVO15194.1 hypothetical protein WJ74_11120 [Burkholderia ubonensis]KVT01081.1 hypothetical protein WK47_24710 [Burkholderia ubonensis]KVT07485.1 hypothetical protein WK46_11185 [Burkholderia ubonensis]KVT33737.1 hypothetical protein WK50_02095 [Burkholderia ubonensis]
MSTCAALWYGLAAEPALADMSLDDLANLSVDSLPAAAAIAPARANLLSEVALPLGSHKGLADRSAILVAELEARATRLDTLYRFSALVMKNGMLPPVIVEGRDAVEATTDQVRVANRMYKAVVRARFVTIAPSWRDYLYVGLRIKQSQDLPFAAVLPKTAAERAYWKEQIMLGYAQGQKLADQILETNRARLDRDYMGMLRYSELLNKGMFDAPTVAVAPSIVSGDRNHINVGDTLYRVTDHGGFVTDPSKWQATITPGTSNAAAAKGGAK